MDQFAFFCILTSNEPAPFVEKAIFFPLDVFSSFVKDQVAIGDMGTGEKFLNRTPIAYALRARIDKWDLIKLQSFCKAKNTVKRTNRQPSN